MERLAVIGAKVIIVAAFAFGVLVQGVFIPLVAAEMAREFPEASHLETPGIIGCIVIVAVIQIALVCLWQLLSLVSTSRIFSTTSFRYVTVMIGCGAALWVLFTAAFIVLDLSRALSGGVALMLIMGAGFGAGLALVLVVMKSLLRQATVSQRELAEVI